MTKLCLIYHFPLLEVVQELCLVKQENDDLPNKLEDRDLAIINKEIKKIKT